MSILSHLDLCPVKGIEVSTYRVATDAPESDGTLEWNHTDIVVVEASAGDQIGLGWSYAPSAAGHIISDVLRDSIIGCSALTIEAAWGAMNRKLRNGGVPGAGSMAIAAVDIALWDLKSKLLGVPLVDLFSGTRDSVMVYGSGGFTSYSDEQLTAQLVAFAAAGCRAVKMKVGREAGDDVRRVRVARKALGDSVQLFVDANGAYTRKQALDLAQRFAQDAAVVWFEEPVSSRDLRGLNFLREHGPAAMDISAGEYGDTLDYFRSMLLANAIDCLQADVTRCGGYTGFLKIAALCDAFGLPLSGHCAPQLHAHVGCAANRLRHVEYFHDHVRIEQLLFDGVLPLVEGALHPDRSRTGLGLTLKRTDAERYRWG